MQVGQMGPVHGGLDLRELRTLGIDPSKVIDFSSSINPLGTPPEIRRVLATLDVATYPDRDCLALREALSDKLDVPWKSILIGNGSTELIHLAARAFATVGKKAFIFTPSFGEYEAAVEIAGGEVHIYPASERDGFLWDIAGAQAELQRVRPALTFLCNPNNPTGILLPPNTIRDIAEAAAPGLVLIDEAYMPLSDSPWDAVPLLKVGNVGLIRSMTKSFGLAGLRLGYLLAQPHVIEQVRRFQQTWSVNSAAQAAGRTAIDLDAHVRDGRDVIRQSKIYLQRRLADTRQPTLPSSANFMLVKVGDGAAVRRRLLESNLCVRDCASFGLPEYIRIAMRKLEDCRRLATEMWEVRTGG